jgi:hypothetical protein
MFELYKTLCHEMPRDISREYFKYWYFYHKICLKKFRQVGTFELNLLLIKILEFSYKKINKHNL